MSLKFDWKADGKAGLPRGEAMTTLQAVLGHEWPSGSPSHPLKEQSVTKAEQKRGRSSLTN